MTDAAYLCSRTGKTYPLDPPLWRAPSGAPLLVTDLPGIRRDQIDTATRSLWRYRAAFPIPVDNPISLGEGCTPLYRSRFRGRTAPSSSNGSPPRAPSRTGGRR